jgi:propionate CoA-transferase
VPDVAIIRATTADERGNLSYEHEGGYLGPLDQALAVRNNGGIVIAQVKRVAKSGTLKPHNVHGARCAGRSRSSSRPIRCRRRRRQYDPAISGEIFRTLSSFRSCRVQRAEGDRAARGAWSCATAWRSISASASPPTCRAC